MSTLTKGIADYHTWFTSEIANGDVIDCEASLGRPADQVTIESIGGATTIRFNVIQKVYHRQDKYNDWMPYAAFYTAPTTPDATVKLPKDDIIIENGATWLWSNEYPIKDIEIVTKALNVKVIIS
jgi:hypothetical protein